MAAPLRLTVFGTSYDILLDHPGLRDTLVNLYRRFTGDGSPNGGPGCPTGTRHLRVRTQQGPELVLDGQPRRISARHTLDHAFIVLNEILLAGARHCRVLHAAALAHHGRALLVAGPATYGKSLLSLLLLERGLGFLGDDFAPLDLATGRILPFPKSLGLRPGVENLLAPATRERLARAPSRPLGSKRLVDIEDLFPGQLAGPAPAAWVVLLVPPGGAPDPGHQVLQIGSVDELPRLPATLAPFGEVEGPHREDEGTTCTYLVTRRTGNGSVRELASALDPFMDDILFIERVAATPPRFDGDPVLEPCPASEGLFILAADLLDRSGPRGRLLDEGEKTAEMVFQLGEHLGPARFMRLRLGRFAAMADLIERLVRGGS
jgi:hypothetical protein